jgi:hypothetical protein
MTALRHRDHLGPTSLVVTSYLVVHKGQTRCTRHCTLGHQTVYSRQFRGPCYKLADERSYKLADQHE